VATDNAHLATTFFAAARALACHSGSLQQRLADAYADHLLAVTSQDLPAELQSSFRELEEHLNQGGPGDGDDDDDEDPFQAAAARLSDTEAAALIERILIFYGRLARAAGSG
jgi:hypothetical protein